MSYRQNSFSALPVVTRYIIVLCVILFAATELLPTLGLEKHLALFNIGTEYFRPHQVVSYIFMHGSIGHIFFNLFGLFMFGRILESVWGPKRFLTFFLITGIGAGLLQLAVSHYELTKTARAVDAYEASPSPDGFWTLLNKNFGEFIPEQGIFDKKDTPTLRQEMKDFVDGWSANRGEKAYAEQSVAYTNQLYTVKENMPTVGASGSLFGILMAFGMLFPNIELVNLFLPIPIKAKYAVVLYAALELFLGVANFSWDNVAHFAHLGGALFGFILVKIWNKDRSNFY